MNARELAQRLIGICDGSQKNPEVQIAATIGGVTEYLEVGDVETCLDLDDAGNGTVQLVPFAGGEFSLEPTPPTGEEQ